MTMQPRTGECSASSARETISLYHALKSSLRLGSLLSAMELRGLRELIYVFVESGDRVLNTFDFRFLEIDFAALRANPSQHGFEREMVTIAIDMERRKSTFHFPLTIHAIHKIIFSF